MTSNDVSEWLDRYVNAWRSYDRDAIRALFTIDAEYRYNPWDPPTLGNDAIADSWLKDKDEPGAWTAEYRPTLVHESIAVVEGQTSYSDGTTYSNLFQLVFDDEGTCSSFTEWYMDHEDD